MGRTPAGETRNKVFRFVRDRLLSGQPPTVREVQEEFHFLSPQTAREHLEGLVADGRLAKDPWKARGYRLPGSEAVATSLVPLLGRLLAGEASAYTYLPHSLSAFLTPEEIASLMKEVGWRDVRYRRLMLGTVAVHAAIR